MSDTMTVQYDEGAAAVNVQVSQFRFVTVERGTPVTVPAKIGKQLCEQGWHEATKPTKTSTKKASDEDADNTTTADTPKENN